MNTLRRALVSLPFIAERETLCYWAGPTGQADWEDALSLEEGRAFGVEFLAVMEKEATPFIGLHLVTAWSDRPFWEVIARQGFLCAVFAAIRHAPASANTGAVYLSGPGVFARPSVVPGESYPDACARGNVLGAAIVRDIQNGLREGGERFNWAFYPGNDVLGSGVGVGLHHALWSVAVAGVRAMMVPAAREGAASRGPARVATP